jgi:hypothetical protein
MVFSYSQLTKLRKWLTALSLFCLQLFGNVGFSFDSTVDAESEPAKLLGGLLLPAAEFDSPNDLFRLKLAPAIHSSPELRRTDLSQRIEFGDVRFLRRRHTPTFPLEGRMRPYTPATDTSLDEECPEP